MQKATVNTRREKNGVPFKSFVQKNRNMQLTRKTVKVWIPAKPAPSSGISKKNPNGFKISCPREMRMKTTEITETTELEVCPPLKTLRNII